MKSAGKYCLFNAVVPNALLAALIVSLCCQSMAPAAGPSNIVKAAVQADDTHDTVRAKLLYKKALKFSLSAADECQVSARLASLEMRSGHCLDAQPHTERAIALARALKKQGQLQHQLAATLTWLGDSYPSLLNCELIDVSEQRITSDQAARNQLAIVELVEGPTQIAVARCAVGLVQMQHKRFGEAEVTYGQIIQDLSGMDPNSGMRLKARLRLALLQKQNGKTKESDAVLSKIKHDLAESRSEASLTEEIASAQLGILDQPAAIDTYNLALTKIDRKISTDRLLEANINLSLGVIYKGQSDFARSEVCYRRAIQMFNQPGSDPFSRLGAMKGLASVLRSEKKYSEADRLMAQARRLNGQITKDSGKWLEDDEREASASQSHQKLL